MVINDIGGGGQALNATTYAESIKQAAMAIGGPATVPVPASILVEPPVEAQPSPETRSETRTAAMWVVLGFSGCLLGAVVLGAVFMRGEERQDDSELFVDTGTRMQMATAPSRHQIPPAWQDSPVLVLGAWTAGTQAGQHAWGTPRESSAKPEVEPP